MSESLLTGWDFGTWCRAIEWAGSDLSPSAMYNQDMWPRFFEVQMKWLKAGGPMDGPSSNIEWVENRGRRTA